MIRRARGLRVAWLAAALGVGSALSCAKAPPEDDPQDAARARLHVFEESARASFDSLHAPASNGALGPDPYAIRSLGDGRFVGLLRGRDAIVLLDARLHEIARAPAGASPSGLAIASDHRVVVAAEGEGALLAFEVEGDRLVAASLSKVPGGAVALRDVVASARGVYAIDERLGEVIAFPAGAPVKVEPICDGPIRLAVAGAHLAVDCLLDHEVVVRALDEHGALGAVEATIRHDGPIWSLDARADGDDLLLALGGVEDHPLDRSDGSFGYIDSFVFVDRVRDRKVERLSSFDVSDAGVVTPKSVLFDERARSIEVAGFGSGELATIALAADRASGEVKTIAAPPGAQSLVADGAGFVFADPLVDAFGRVSASGEVALVRVADDDARSRDERLGEALIFTTLIAPWNESKGKLSRFTCEACHFEGGVDGRTHWTGRGDVHATTRSLRGLFPDRPYFSRALDADLVSVAFNEFSVAGKGSGKDPWFHLAKGDVAWLGALGVGDALEPEEMRRAFIAFFERFTPRANPMTRGRSSLDALERDGLRVFGERCERCHAARLVAADASTRVTEDRWASLVLAPNAPILWARSELYRTGVEPYVNDELGARVPQLRGLAAKHPYFTNGSAKSIDEVLTRAGFTSDGGFFHDRAPAGAARLAPSEASALAAFLKLL